MPVQCFCNRFWAHCVAYWAKHWGWVIVQPTTTLNVELRDLTCHDMTWMMHQIMRRDWLLQWDQNLCLDPKYHLGTRVTETWTQNTLVNWIFSVLCVWDSFFFSFFCMFNVWASLSVHVCYIMRGSIALSEVEWGRRCWQCQNAVWDYRAAVIQQVQAAAGPPRFSILIHCTTPYHQTYSVPFFSFAFNIFNC